MSNFVDMTGQEIDGLLCVCHLGNKGDKAVWEVRCRCGVLFEAAGSALRLRRRTSCPTCASKRRVELATKHGDVGTLEYRAYNSMKTRCYNQKNKRYDRYGGRGIKVCERWMESYQHFLADMGRKPTPEHSLERKDTDGDYCPENCIWATLTEQANNRSNNSRIEIGGVTKNITEWASLTGVHRTVILRRMKRGLTGAALIEKHSKPVIVFNGATDTYAGWAARTGLARQTIAARLQKHGWPVERALTEGATNERTY